MMIMQETSGAWQRLLKCPGYTLLSVSVLGLGTGAVYRQLAWQLGLGLLIGITRTLPWSAMLADPDMNTRAHDPAVFVPVLMVLCVALIAALPPWALRVDPVVALRCE